MAMSGRMGKLVQRPEVSAQVFRLGVARAYVESSLYVRYSRGFGPFDAFT